MQLDDYLKLPYTITLKPDDEGDWIAEIDELEGCVAHGETQDQALSRLAEAKKLWIQEALENAQPVPKPNPTESLPSGKWLQRVPRSLHKNLSRLAKIEGVSLNQLVTMILSTYVGSNGEKKHDDAWRDWSNESAGWVMMSGAAAPPRAVGYLRVFTHKLPGVAQRSWEGFEDVKDQHAHAERR